MTRSWSTRSATLRVEESLGTDRGRRFVMLHGFSQTSASWDPFVDALGDEPTIVRVDAPGHGGSPILEASLGEVATIIVDEVGAGTYIGYSMGARILLHAAFEPTPMTGLVLVGGTPGIEDADERSRRRDSDGALARRIADEGVDEFLRWWLSQPLFAGLRPTESDLVARRSNTVAGLTSSLRHCGVGEQTPLWERLSDIRIPVLVLAGERDHKFVDIGRRMASAIGDNAAFVSIPDTGHAAHLERPDAVAAIVRDWTN